MHLSRAQDLDVHKPNSQFSRKKADSPAFRACVTHNGRLPSLTDIVAAERASAGPPVRFSTVEKGDIAFYGFERIQLPNILR